MGDFGGVELGVDGVVGIVEGVVLGCVRRVLGGEFILGHGGKEVWILKFYCGEIFIMGKVIYLGGGILRYAFEA